MRRTRTQRTQVSRGNPFRDDFHAGEANSAVLAHVRLREGPRHKPVVALVHPRLLPVRDEGAASESRPTVPTAVSPRRRLADRAARPPLPSARCASLVLGDRERVLHHPAHGDEHLLNLEELQRRRDEEGRAEERVQRVHLIEGSGAEPSCEKSARVALESILRAREGGEGRSGETGQHGWSCLSGPGERTSTPSLISHSVHALLL